MAAMTKKDSTGVAPGPCVATTTSVAAPIIPLPSSTCPEKVAREGVLNNVEILSHVCSFLSYSSIVECGRSFGAMRKATRESVTEATVVAPGELSDVAPAARLEGVKKVTVRCLFAVGSKRDGVFVNDKVANALPLFLGAFPSLQTAIIGDGEWSYGDVRMLERRERMRGRNDAVMRKLVEGLCDAYRAGVLKKDTVVEGIVFNGMCERRGVPMRCSFCWGAAMALPMATTLKMVPMEMRLPGRRFLREMENHFCTCMNSRRQVLLALDREISDISAKGNAKKRDSIKADVFFETVALVEGGMEGAPTRSAEARALSMLLELVFVGVAPRLERSDVLNCVRAAREKKMRVETTASVLHQLRRLGVPVEPTDFDIVHLTEGAW